MLNYKLNATGAFTPAAVDLPDAINPEQVLHHRGSAQGRYRGDRQFPSIIVLHLEFHINGKGILQKPI